jgi:hypothetical protein
MEIVSRSCFLTVSMPNVSALSELSSHDVVKLLQDTFLIVVEHYHCAELVQNIFDLFQPFYLIINLGKLRGLRPPVLVEGCEGVRLSLHLLCRQTFNVNQDHDCTGDVADSRS